MADVYAVAMEFNLQDKATEGIKNITASLSQMTAALEKAHTGMTALAATLAGAAGAGIVLGMTKIMESADNLNRSLTRMQIQGQDTARAMQAVRQVFDIRGISPEQSMQLLAQMRPFFGMRAEDQLLRATMTQEQLKLFGDPGGYQSMLQMAQRQGLTAPGREQQFQQFQERILRIVQSTGGPAGGGLSVERINQALLRGGLSGTMMSPEMMDIVLPTLLMGGVGGRMSPVQSIQRLEQGALSLERGKGLGAGGINRAALEQFLGVRNLDPRQIAESPYQFSQQMVRQMQSQGMLTGDPQRDQERIKQMLMMMFRDKGTQAILAQMMAQGEVLMGTASPFYRQREMFERAGGTSERTMGLLDKDNLDKLEKVGQAWNTLMTDVGKADTDLFGSILDSIRGFIVWIDSIVKDTPPEVIKAITIGILGFGAALAALGVIMAGSLMVGLLPGGAFAVGIGVLIASIGLLAGIAWQPLRDTFEYIYTTIASWIRRFFGLKSDADALKQTSFNERFSAVPWHYNSTMLGWPAGILQMFASALGGAGNEFPGGRQSGGYTGTEPAPSWMGHTGFWPGTEGANKPLNLGVTMNIDGQTISKVIWTNLAEINQFPIGASAANHDAGWPMDSNYQHR